MVGVTVVRWLAVLAARKRHTAELTLDRGTRRIAVTDY